MSLGSTNGWFIWRAEGSIDLSRLLLSLLRRLFALICRLLWCSCFSSSSNYVVVLLPYYRKLSGRGF